MERVYLLDAYIRRKRWEFNGQAEAIMLLLAQAMGMSAHGRHINGYRKIDADAMFDRLGFNH